MRKIAIFGAGGFGREVKLIIDAINLKKTEYEFIGFFDDGFSKGTIVNDFPVLGGINELNTYAENLDLAIAIGNPTTKKRIIEQLHNQNINFPTLIHPSAIISNDYVQIERGTIICAGNILTCNINVGEFVILNLCCTVGHDTKIGSYSSFMPSVNISGEVVINESVYVGTGAKIINQLEIGENTVVGAGAVVSKSLPANCTAVGIPAKPIKFNSHE